MASTSENSNLDPVDPRIATGAQIRLQSFVIPEFPLEAAALKALTLTSDIKVDEYPELLKKFEPIPALPTGVESLTLELFSLGYPPGFLAALAKRLPNIKSLVLYSQLFGGITTESEADAISFFETMTDLRALHMLDIFARSGFLDAVGRKLAGCKKGLMFLEISYAFQPGDDDFLTRVRPSEILSFVSPSLITCAFNISPPIRTDDEQDPTNLNENGEQIDRNQQGIEVVGISESHRLVESLTQEKTAPKNLKILNCTLYTLEINQLEDILKSHKRLGVLNATLQPESSSDWISSLMSTLAMCLQLEQIEIVINPVADTNTLDVEKSFFPLIKDVSMLSKSLPSLSRFCINVLRDPSLPSAVWEMVGKEWKNGLTKQSIKS